jgi:glutamate synthase domain-containing protein 2
VLALLLRVRLGPLRLEPRQGRPRPGLPLQGRPGGQDRHRRPPPRRQGPGQDRRRPQPPARHRRDQPATFADLHTPKDYRRIADQVREVGGGIPIGFKLSAQHIEDDLDFALKVGVDYIILDGRGGGTGAAPDIFKNNISVPTIPALARARRHLDRKRKADHVTLIITGGLRNEADFVKALALGADGVAIANSALQAIGCLGMRACHTNNCPVGIATQKPHLRARLDVEKSAQQLANYLHATTELMQILARACGHDSLHKFSPADLTTFDREMAHLSGVAYGGVDP